MNEPTDDEPTDQPTHDPAHEPTDDLGALAQALSDLLSAFRDGAGLTQRQLADRIGYARVTIATAEGGQRTPASGFWSRCDDALGAGGALRAAYDQLAAARHARNARKRRADQARRDADVAARDLPAVAAPSMPLATAADLTAWRGDMGEVPARGPGFAPSVFAAELAIHAPVPAGVGWAEVEHVRAATSGFAAAENLRGGGPSCEAAAGQLRWATRLLDARAGEQVGRALVEAVGNLAGVVAFSAFDVGDHRNADRCFRFALWCAEEAGSWSLRAATLTDMARHAAYLGNLDEALSLVEFAQVRADRLTGTARAMVSTVRARILALLGRHAEAAAAVEQADGHFADREHSTDPPWLAYYDEAEHLGSTARALTPRAIAEGNPGQAGTRLEGAIRLHSAGFPRSKAFSRTRLATLTMTVGDPDHAAHLGRQALTDVAGLQSRRVRDELSGLHRATDRHARNPEVANLRLALADALSA